MSASIRSKRTVALASDTSAAQAERSLAGLIQALRSPEWQALDLHVVERRLFAEVLELGALLLRVFLERKGTGRSRRIQAGETTIPYHSQKTRRYLSVFGTLEIERAYFWSESSTEGVFPLDRELNLPARRVSYVLQELATLFATREAYEKVTDALERVFGLKLWKQTTETLVRECGADVQRFYENTKPASQADEGEVLVVAVDGKGVPIRKPDRAKKTIRRSSGVKKNKKKIAVVSAVYTIDRRTRTPEEVVASLFDDSPGDRRVDPIRPKNKRLRAKLGPAKEGFAEILRHAGERSPGDPAARVLLLDGEKRMVEKAALPAFGAYTKVIDFLHAAQYVWDAGVAIYGEGKPKTRKWVRQQMLRVLRGEGESFADDVEEALAKRKWKSKVLLRVIRYFRAYPEWMRYDEYLAAGIPIATGVVEGACCTLVKDRTDRSSMRWTVEGAQAVLELRAVDQNGDWVQFWTWFRRAERRRLYARRWKAA